MSDEKPAGHSPEHTDEQASSADAAGSARQQSVHRRDAAAGSGEDSDSLREKATAALEAAVQAKVQVEQLNVQLREANQRLVVATILAQENEEHADHANRLKDDFLAMVSHELRTPLSAVLGWAQMLRSKQLTPEREAQAIKTIERNAASLAHIIDDLLDVSRIIAGTLHMTPQPLDLVAVTQTALDVVKPLAVKRRVELRLSVEPGSPALVSGDDARLQQVIWNLLTNAVKFTPAGGRVDVSIERVEGSSIDVKVADTGQGIAPEFLPHVFERFRQADGAPSRRHGGLGLGLAIVRQLVELHGGSVRVASEGLGRGATFTVRLPILAAGAHESALLERRSAASMKSPTLRVQRLDDLRILVVDDDDDGRTLTTVVLRQAHANVRAVASALEALQLVEVERPDVLVSDIGLPDEDGYSLIRQIRRHEAHQGGFLPAIALTGYARAEDRIRALAAGFQAHVVKPVAPAELIAVIADVTGHSKSR